MEIPPNASRSVPACGRQCGSKAQMENGDISVFLEMEDSLVARGDYSYILGAPTKHNRAAAWHTMQQTVDVGIVERQSIIRSLGTHSVIVLQGKLGPRESNK